MLSDRESDMPLGGWEVYVCFQIGMGGKLLSRIVEGIVRIFCITGVIILSFLLYQKWHRLETEQAQFEQNCIGKIKILLAGFR